MMNQPTISGGVPPYSVTVVGLPGFLSSDTVTGRITGTLEPLDNVDYPDARLEWTVTDSGDPQQTASATSTLEILPLGVSITTTELDPAPIGQVYRMVVVAANGLQPYTWEIAAGVLPGSSSDPDPLELDQDSGVISGTPVAGALTSTFTIKVTDSDEHTSTDSQEFKLVIPVAVVDQRPGRGYHRRRLRGDAWGGWRNGSLYMGTLGWRPTGGADIGWRCGRDHGRAYGGGRDGNIYAAGQ